MKRAPLTRLQVGSIEHLVEKAATLQEAAARVTALHTAGEREYAYALVCRRFNVKLTAVVKAIEELELGDDE